MKKTWFAHVSIHTHTCTFSKTRWQSTKGRTRADMTNMRGPLQFTWGRIDGAYVFAYCRWCRRSRWAGTEWGVAYTGRRGLAFQVKEVKTCLSSRTINQPLDLCEGSSPGGGGWGWGGAALEHVRHMLTLRSNTSASAQALPSHAHVLINTRKISEWLHASTPLSSMCLCVKGLNIV